MTLTRLAVTLVLAMGAALTAAQGVAQDGVQLGEARIYRTRMAEAAATLALAQYYGEVPAADVSAHLRQRAGLWWRADPPAAEADAWRASLVRLSDRLVADAEAHVARMPATAAREPYESHLRGWRLSLRVARDTGRDLFEPLAQIAAIFDVEMVRDPAGLWRVLEQVRAEATRLVSGELSRPLVTTPSGTSGSGAAMPTPTQPAIRPPAPADLGSWWSQQENGLHGIWVRRPGTSTFDAYWAENYVKSTLEIAISGTDVRIRRFQGTDGYTCDYTGTLTGAEVNGTFTCDREPRPMRWRAWIQGAAATAPPVLPPVPPPGGNVPSLLGTWSVGCCGDTLSGTLLVTDQQGPSFSGRMEGGLWSESITGQVRGDVVEFERRTDEGPQQWTGRLTGGGAALRIVAGAWKGAYAGRFTPAQLTWHAEKQR